MVHMPTRATILRRLDRPIKVIVLLRRALPHAHKDYSVEETCLIHMPTIITLKRRYS